ncbi:glutamyl-tRNA reductase [Myceligenerans pegani]|uniref:Glutamyl-tRNA reductase n=1 Tax=Myceligenerans pegani TaxID=2776917 RepID=A0ABR9N2X5_9MICO|nr:glutamyl-tRNA reductase [Myceligenerans sp. TRM 65318]MBE1877996.1 glutamyl-tRNA reductase [Myceligenerans sp. TRM 65318]MBE3020267.1 glutamyl-tRNA reductase [Myceligenerans sp. TRM 65318]
MVLLSLTASHRELDLDALERLSMGSASVGRTVVGTCRPVVGAVVISTCNRFELYLDVDAPLDGHTVGHATRHVAELVAGESGVSTQTAVGSFTVRTGPEVTEHLFAVAAGLDSMVVGEREIAGQVKRSLAVAREQETTSKTLELLFQTASRTSKRVGTDTELGAAGRSVVSLALDLAESEVSRWDTSRAVLIGTGSYAGASVAALRARGCTDIGVYSQSGRAALFAESHGVDAVDDLIAALADADVVVSCSGARGRGSHPGTTAVVGARDVPRAEPDTSPHVTAPGAAHGDGAQVGASAQEAGTPGPVSSQDRPAPEASLGHVLDAAAVVRARERAADRAGDEPEPTALVVLDLALHRDVDPQVADVEGVLLYDLASLKAHAPAVALDVVGQARDIVDDAARAFEETRLGREADAAVVALLDEAEVRVRAEVDDAVARLAEERAAAGDPPPTPEDVDGVARGVRRRIHADLHPRIVAVRAEARARARAQEAAVIEGAESITRAAGTPAHRTS